MTTGADLGKKVTSNGLELTLKSQQCGVSEIKGSGTRVTKAIGEFCVYKVAVRNGSDKQLRFSIVDFSMSSASGRDYKVSSDASIAIPDNRFISENVPPQGAGTALVVVDVAVGDKPATLKFGGVLVTSGTGTKAEAVSWALP